MNKQAHQIIVAIGGGEIGGPIFDATREHILGYHDIETTAIDERIIALSGKKAPHVLFVPTASNDAAGYCTAFQKHYGDNLGCKVSNLLLHSQISLKQIEEAVSGADIIYVGGGSTTLLQQKWQEKGVIPLLQKAYENGTILCGLSAGANCWFEKSGAASSMTPEEKADLEKAKKKFDIIDCLNFIQVFFCPHYLHDTYRRPVFLDKLKDLAISNGDFIAYGVDNNAALVFVDGKMTEAIKSKPQAKAYEISLQSGKMTEKEII